MKGQTSYYHLANLNPNRITIARELRGLTKKDLANKIGKSPSAITQYEAGQTQPEIEAFNQIAMALGFPVSFFSKNDILALDMQACHFRAKRGVAQTKRRQAFRQTYILLELVNLLERKGIQFPKARLLRCEEPNVSGTKIEQHAIALRNSFGLGLGPIPGLINLLESLGVFVFFLDEVCSDIDAYSLWASEKPCILLVPDLGKGSRIQFDLAHELAHLYLHDDINTNDLAIEREANRFAGAFLVPAKSLEAECPPRWNYFSYLELKQRWHVSMQALLYRARQIGVISESTFKWGMVDISSRGKRKEEDGEFLSNPPLLLQQAFDFLKSELTITEIASEIGVHQSTVEEILLRQHVSKDVLILMSPKAVAVPDNLVQFTPNVDADL